VQKVRRIWRNSFQQRRKSALTRALNKLTRSLPFSQGAPIKGRKKAVPIPSLEIDEEGHEVELGDDNEEEEEDELD